MALRKRLESDFLKNSLTLIGGSSIAQIIPVISAPILSRIYSPSDYGNAGLYISLSSVIGIFSTLQYSNAFLLPKKEDDFYSLVKLSFKNAIITSLICLIFIVVMKNYIGKLLNAEYISQTFLLIPLSMFLTGVSTTLSAFANRRKVFKIIAVNRVLAAISNVVVSLGFGLLFRSWIGLLIGYLVNQFINSLILIISLWRITPKPIIIQIWRSQTSKVKKEYLSFPKVSLATDFINALTYQMPVFVLNTFANPGVVGMYNICNRILGLPLSFIASAIAEVFKQKVSETFHAIGSCRLIYRKTFKSLLLLSIVPFSILIIWGPDLFGFFLGERWREAGVFARILAPLYLLRFINSPLSFIIYLFRRLKFDLAATIYLNISNFIILYSTLKFWNVNAALICFSANYCLVYLFMLQYTSKLSKQTI